MLRANFLKSVTAYLGSTFFFVSDFAPVLAIDGEEDEDEVEDAGVD